MKYMIRYFSSEIKKNKLNKDIFIVLINNKQAINYYKWNTLFLLFYSGYSFISGYISDYPDYLKNTIKTFGFITTSVLIGLFIFSNRHIRSLIFNKTKDTLLVETFRGYGMLNPKVNELRIKEDIKYIYSLKSIIKIDLGLYVVKLRDNNKKLYSFFNVLLMRPVDIEDKEELTKLMKRVLKK